MIYVATVHWKDHRWIHLQQEFMKRYIKAPFQIYAYLNNISPELHGLFDHVRDKDDPSHSQKLNILAQDILQKSNDDSDIIVFMDGDAFPIAPLNDWMHLRLQEYPLIAVQRTENIGDIQPHPCFCVTTVGFWRAINGDWSEGYEWRLENGALQTDVGGNLLKILLEKSIPWLKMRRTNTVNLHELMFGVYENIVYHHGAGFRPQKGGRISLDKAGAHRVFKKFEVRILEKCIPKSRLMQFRFSVLHPYGRLRRRIFKKGKTLSEKVYEQIVKNHHYVYTFIKPVSRL